MCHVLTVCLNNMLCVIAQDLVLSTCVALVVVGVQGLCLGILIGAAATDACFLMLMWHTDWDLEAEKAAERVTSAPANSTEAVALDHVVSCDIDDVINSRFTLDGEDTAETTGLLTQGTKTQQDSSQLL